jgi:hypothetical protein
MFPNEPALSQSFDPSITSIDQNVRNTIGDIRQPWVEMGNQCGVSEFAAKALFALGMMRRYILSANAVLKEMRYHGFLSAYSLLSSSVELLGRCIHRDIEVRQHPVRHSGRRLKAGLEYIRNPSLQQGVIAETNHHTDAVGGYNVGDLMNLRNLVVHGACISHVPGIKADIELLHHLRVLLYGVPFDEQDPHLGLGPHRGALDRYCEELLAGDQNRCNQLATAAISPSPTRLQGGDFPFSVQVVNEMREHVQQNLATNRFPLSGSYSDSEDFFRLYP